MVASGTREPGAAEALVGRGAELAALGAAVVGGARCVVVEGAAGMGKTALLRRFLADAGTEGARTAVATAERSEALVDHALADQLLRALGVARPDVLASAGVAEAGLRLLDALSDASGGELAVGRLVVAVDDAQWADGASLRALLFALRRVVEEPVTVVVAIREGTGDRLPAGLWRLDGVRRIALAGLRDEDVRALAHAEGRDLSARAARRLREHAGGAPLYVRALLAEVPPAAWEAGELPPPAPELFASGVRRRLAAAPPGARALVEAAAVLGARCPLHAAARVGGVAEPLAALEAAARTGSLAAGDDRAVTFDHPLTRAAVYHALGPARRARLHAAAAEVVADRGAALRHRAAAAVGPEPALVAELEAFAYAETRRDAWESASAAYAAAARLCDGAARDRLQLEAADALLGAGRAAGARALLAERDPAAPDSPLLLATLAHPVLAGCRLDEAERRLERAWALDADWDVRRRIAERRAVLALGRLRPDDVIAWARRSAEVSAHDPFARAAALWPVALGLVMRGDPTGARAVLDETIAGVGGEHGPGAEGFRGMRAWARLLEDDVAGALDELHDAAASARRVGGDALVAALEAALAGAELAAGRWDDARARAERAHALADDDAAAPGARLVVLAIAAARGELADGAASGGRGRAAVADAAADGADAAAVAASAADEAADATPLGRVSGAVARAVVAGERGRPHEVVDALAPLRAGDEWDAAVAWHGTLHLPALLADALVRIGRLDEADALLREHEGGVPARPSRAAALARARGRLEAARGRPDAAAAALVRAVALAEPLGIPYDLALARLALGQHLRRQGQRRRAVAVLTQARDALRELRAAPALAQCERELEASGLEPVKRAEMDRSALTARERAVARLAARGLTNRQIADELMVSVKTIETHLSRVLSKLGVGSRGEIAARLDAP